jgi:HTH-type transcriptional regulator, transcriptional repressor of NAD biosynthesis genes
MSRGLVFGKFMPLHRGHELLIERAVEASGVVTVVVYDSSPPGEYPAMPIDLRARWIAELFPDIEAVVPLPDPRRDANDGDDPRHAELYTGQLAFLGQFERVFSGEPKYERFAQLIAAEHVVVEEARSVPISGTAIREDVYGYRAWLDPHVYATLIRKIAIVGTESTGKTTLAQELARRLDTLWAHEYGRELWVDQGGGASFADYLKIARTQQRREEELRRDARRFLFCDTTPWTTLHWCLWMHGTADPRVFELADRTMNDYTWFVCADDFPWVQDGSREMGDGQARRFQEQQVADLEARGVPYVVLEGSTEERISLVHQELGELTAETVR